MNCIYALIDPRDSQVRYIGKTRQGIDNRLRQHISIRKAVRSSHWVHHLLRAGYMPEAIELESGLSELEWPDSEQFWIAYFKSIGADLTNHTNGGHHFTKKRGLEPHVVFTKGAFMWLAKNRSLHGTEYKILFFILGCIDYDNRAILTQSYIAKHLDMPQPQVSAAIKKLADCGAINKISVGGVNGYEVSQKLVSRGSLTK